MERKPVFLILAHSNIPELKKLLWILSHYKGVCVLYFASSDKKLKKGLKKDLVDSSVHILEDTRECYWGSILIVEAYLKLLRYGVEKFPDAAHFHFISGQCAPLKDPVSFNKFFNQNLQKTFMQFVPLPNQKWADSNFGFDRINFFHFNDVYNYRSRNLMARISHRLLYIYGQKIQKILKVNRRKPAGLEKFMSGSQWISITHDAAKWVLSYLKENPQFLKFFRRVYVPDELFFQTVFSQSPFVSPETHSKENLRYIDWTPKNNERLPRVLNLADHAHELQRSDCYFARKIPYDNAAFLDFLLKELKLSEAYNSKFGTSDSFQQDLASR